MAIVIDFEEALGDDTPTNPDRDCWVVFVCREKYCPDHKSLHRLILCIEATTGAVKHLASTDKRQATVLSALREEEKKTGFRTATRPDLLAILKGCLDTTLVNWVTASGHPRSTATAWAGFVRHFDPLTKFHFDETSNLKFVIARAQVEPKHYDFHLDNLFFHEVAKCNGK